MRLPAMDSLISYGFTRAMTTNTSNRWVTLVLDGRNAPLAEGVRRALGRRSRDFGGSGRDAAATGAWTGRRGC